MYRRNLVGIGDEFVDVLGLFRKSEDGRRKRRNLLGDVCRDVILFGRVVLVVVRLLCLGSLFVGRRGIRLGGRSGGGVFGDFWIAKR